MAIRVFLTSIMVFFACNILSAQQMAKVKSFSMTTDHIPGEDRRSDLNGVPCALIKIQVLDEIERIEGNKIGKIVNKGVEKWVYMCKGSRNIRIHFKNHLPIRVMFQDYHINGLESNRVYELVIEVSTPKSYNSIDVKGNNLQMKVSPTNAFVYIWGDNLEKSLYRPQNDGTIKVYLPYGRYHYQIKADGYYDKDGSVFVDDNIEWENIDMEIIKGNLTIICPTEEVDLYVDDRLVLTNTRNTEWKDKLLPGKYNIEVRKKGYTPYSQIVDVIANQDNIVRINELMPESKRRKENQKSSHYSYSETHYNNENGNSFALRLTAGYNMATAQFGSNNDGETKPINSFFAGMIAEFRLSQYFYITTGITYSAKGYQYENLNDDLKETANPQFVDVPIQASFRIPFAKLFNMEINVGPYASFCIGGNVKDEYWSNGYNEPFSSSYGSFDYGLQAGVGFNIIYHIHLGVNYQMGMAKDYQNRNLMIGIGYRF